MTFGYNAATAFGQSTSDVIDHAKGLLSSLADRREESEVYVRQSLYIGPKIKKYGRKKIDLLYSSHTLSVVLC